MIATKARIRPPVGFTHYGLRMLIGENGRMSDTRPGEAWKLLDRDKKDVGAKDPESSRELVLEGKR